VFTAKPVIVKGRYTQASDGYITVRGLLRGKPWSRRVHVTLPPVDADGGAMATLWAREKIEDLQNQDWVGAQTRNPKGDIKDAIVALALEYRLMSQYTSFVAVEQRIVNVGGKQRTVDVPVEMPEGVSYEGIFGDAHKAVVGGTVLASRARGVSRAFGEYGGLGSGAPPLTGALAPGGGRPAASAPAAGKSTAAGEQLYRRVAGPKGDPGDRLEEREALRMDLSDLYSTEGKRVLAKLKPEERRDLLRRAKLSEPLQKRIAKGVKGKLEVQVWLNKLPSDGLKKLKASGFALAAHLRPNKLLLGTIAAEKLDAVLELDFVRAVEEPRMK
jgi:Ca-activated chloride channel family protein